MDAEDFGEARMKGFKKLVAVIRADKRTAIVRSALSGFALLAAAEAGLCAESAGVVATLEMYQGPAAVRVETLKRFKVQIDLERNGETGPLTLVVELSNTGHNA